MGDGDWGTFFGVLAYVAFLLLVAGVWGILLAMPRGHRVRVDVEVAGDGTVEFRVSNTGGLAAQVLGVGMIPPRGGRVTASEVAGPALPHTLPAGHRAVWRVPADVLARAVADAGGATPSGRNGPPRMRGFVSLGTGAEPRSPQRVALGPRPPAG